VKQRDVYFEVSSVIIAFVLLGKFMEEAIKMLLLQILLISFLIFCLAKKEKSLKGKRKLLRKWATWFFNS
jgi:hypothetical protein